MIVPILHNLCCTCYTCLSLSVCVCVCALATFLAYFQYCLAGWMTVLAFNVFLVFTLKVKKKKANRLHLLYHVFAWGIGIPIIIIGLSIDRFDYLPPQPICFISSQVDGWPQLGLYTFPIFTLCAITFFCCMTIVWRIWMVCIDGWHLSLV
jgi:hypothetical protein